MTLAAKHFDPIIGVDTHLVLPPGSPAPVPLPHPYVGMVFDPMDYLPFIGASVMVNGLPRGQAGSGGMQVVHFPLGAPSGPPPSGESEIFMGSATVAFDGDAQSLMSLPALSCQSIGMPGPPRPKGSPPKSLVLPTSVVLPIPAGPPVLIGGPPIISLQVLATKAAFKGLGKLGKMLRKAQRGPGKFGRAMQAISRRANEAGKALAEKIGLGETGRNAIKRAICTVTGHPVDVATGKVFTDRIDLALPGPIPFEFERVWYSTSTYVGPLGHGWHHSYDAGLYVRPEVVLYRAPDGRAISFPQIEEGEEFFLGTERLTLRREHGAYEIQDAARRVYEFRPVGRVTGEYALLSIRDRVGRKIGLKYDERGLLRVIIDSAGRELGLEYDAAGRVVALSAPHPDNDEERVVMMRYGYDARGNLSEAIDALGQRVKYAYRGYLLSQETDRNGLSFYFTYDGVDATARCIRTWGDGGIYDHRIEYDSARGMTTVTNSLGFKTQYEHLGGLVTRTVDANGGMTRCVYDEEQHLVEEVDALGRSTPYEYDVRGNVTGVVRPDGSQVRMKYDERDLLIETTDALGGTWAFRYDDNARMVERIDPVGSALRYRYGEQQLEAVIDAAGNETQLQFDRQANLRCVRSPDGAEQTFAYDRLGRMRESRDPAQNERQRHYDLLGRVTQIREPDRNTRTLSYDPEGHVVHARDALHDVRFEYCGMGRLRARSEAGTTVYFEYDTEEQLTGIVNEHGYVYRFELSMTGEVLVESGFDGVRRNYERDLAGRVIELTRASGVLSRFEYDGADRLTRVGHSDGTQEQFAYRLDGELIRAAKSGSQVTFIRDPLGRVIREIQPRGSVASEYDQRGLRVRMQSSLGADQTIVRDAMGEVVSLDHRGKAQDRAFTMEIARDILGLEVERTLPGGVRNRWKRDKLGRPVQQEISAGGVYLRRREYNWDVDERLRQIIDDRFGSTEYHHDALGNLARALYGDGTQELRMPDAVGNLFRTEARDDRKYGPAGQLLESIDDHGRVTRYGYDADGNLILKERGREERWEYEWSVDGTLKRVTRPNGAQVTFTYDALGRRLTKTYRGQTTHWVWDGNVPLHEWVEGALEAVAERRDTADFTQDGREREADLDAHLRQGPATRGNVSAPITWLFEPDCFEPVARLGGNNQGAVMTDHLGSAIALFDARGEQIWSAQAGIYGGIRRQNGASEYCPLRWPGQYEDCETGLFYNRFRYYCSDSGQYLSPDPLRCLKGILLARYAQSSTFNHVALSDVAGPSSLYSYVSDPLSEWDPLGLIRLVLQDGVDVQAYPGPEATGHRPEHRPLHVHVQEKGEKTNTRVLMEDWTDGGRVKARRGEVYPGDRALTKRERKVVEKHMETLPKSAESVFRTGKC